MRPALALAALAAVLLGAAAPADAATRTYTLRTPAWDVGGFNTVTPSTRVKAPKVTGYVTKFDAYLVHDGAPRGERFPLEHVMLHHVLFQNASRKADPACGRDKPEPIWGTGEERQRLSLPRGYGIPLRKGDRWRMGTMLMSHGIDSHRVRLEYRVTVVTGRRLVPVKPLWLRGNGCTAGYNLDGGGAPGSIDRRSHDWTVPVTGRIVAAGAHTHAGNVALDVEQPRCGGRRVIRHLPRFGLPGDRVYRVRPLLHEPGPIATSSYRSARGIPVVKGETLRVTSLYEAQWARPEVMGITHLYVARDRRAAEDRCAPLPPDRPVWTRKDGRPSAPHLPIPFNAWDDRRGRTVVIERPPGRVVDGGDAATVQIRDDRFEPANLTVNRGATITWDWVGKDVHNVWHADGPRMTATYQAGRGATLSKRLDTPGTYKLFCFLHPLTMHQSIQVR